MNNNVKFVDVQQAKIINLHKNIKDKLLRTNAVIWYNKVCRTKHLANKDAHIKIKDNNSRKVATKKWKHLDNNLIIKCTV
jgi:hypothetical protein